MLTSLSKATDFNFEAAVNLYFEGGYGQTEPAVSPAPADAPVTRAGKSNSGSAPKRTRSRWEDEAEEGVWRDKRKRDSKKSQEPLLDDEAPVRAPIRPKVLFLRCSYFSR